MSARRALLVGATGLVGETCLDMLLEDPAYERVVVFVRRPLGRGHAKLEQHVTDFDHLDDFSGMFEGDDLFCCLGTTIKKAGSREAFRRVDYEYVLKVARLASRAGVRQLLVISAYGADENSRFFYNRTKGLMEKAISEFDFAGIGIFRPSLLLGKRREFRAGEESGKALARLFSFALVGPLARHKPIEARAVAAAMIGAARSGISGVQVFEAAQMRDMA